MKKILSLALLLVVSSTAFAHYLWIETNATGTANQEQEIKVYFGEYTYGVKEKIGEDAFERVKDFELWVVDPKGNKIPLEVTATEDYYLAKYTPKSKGTHTVIMDNANIDVIDYTKYDFGIFKTHYHGIANIQVGKKDTDTVAQNETGITVQRVASADDAVTLRVLFQGEPLAKNELTVFVADQWSKTLHTDEAGLVSFDLPWEGTQYIIETTTKEEVPGTFRGEDYQFVWNCVTYSIQN
ncbi:DUF4198 domain-containing protein [Reichenbachiella agariperforans]|uniref:DUF4198 domain-containing protein n=1 Tax=Reichenbachiella agariperforans TaxID=156994 RepID=UPI00093434BF|nr:DUF4198 domain-containing protein [Reichenbachiella agariperforans]MBU2913261.1 DUF4198 domain-containing protein [Reichenbachiella agariperforans]